MTDSPESDELAIARATALGPLLQHVGYALWQAAECEDALACWVVVALRPTRGIGADGAAPIVRKAQRRTFGQLMAELKKAAVLEAGLISRVEELVRERNWLVHQAKQENRGVLNDPKRLDDLVVRIGAIAEEATNLQALLGSALEEYVARAGVDRKVIDSEADRLIREWGYDL